ncbi:MAG: hypothetical protein EKK29_17260 [Hyphomicrobiales bacterium]|nr:MAG: hypothetical protein EKK29_17260 [Hyphomicrobiales bacterium]
MSLKVRLKKLEVANKPQRTFVIWASSGVDVEAETERLREERGMIDSDLLLVISWSSGENAIALSV